MTKQQDPLLRYIAFTNATLLVGFALAVVTGCVAILADLLGF